MWSDIEGNLPLYIQVGAAECFPLPDGGRTPERGDTCGESGVPNEEPTGFSNRRPLVGPPPPADNKRLSFQLFIGLINPGLSP
jgi:hypothetical protein